MSIPTSSTTSSTPSLPDLVRVDVAQLPDLRPPRPRIRNDVDLSRWRTTPSYGELQLYLTHLTAASADVPLDSPLLAHPSGAIQSLVALLDAVERIARDIPPLPTPQRYGNLAFRTFHNALASALPDLLSSLLPDNLHGAIPHLTPHLLACFGNQTRMDYGTGHELSFLLFLLTLALLRFLAPTQEEERHTALVVFPRYLKLCWMLQDRYRLEPAGSHGVWGLDDYHFLPYMLGAAQLLHAEVPPSYILSLASHSQSHQPTHSHPHSLTGTLPPTSASTLEPQAPPNLYEQMIRRVLTLKSGPFAEHSPQLYSIASSVLTWAKVLSGLRKMYDAEVLGKRVVVQHLALGGVLEWDWKEEAKEPQEDGPSETADPAGSGEGGGGPTAAEVGMDGPVVTAAPWASRQRRTFPLTWESSLPATSNSTQNRAGEAEKEPPTVPAWPAAGEELPPPPKISAGSTRRNEWGSTRT